MDHPKPPVALAPVCAQFAFAGRFVSGEPHGNGHINDTFVVTHEQAGRTRRYILQRINTHVFRDVPSLMENIQRVSAHAARKTDGAAADAMKTLTVIPTHDGRSYFVDQAGGPWRGYDFIEGATSHDLLQDPAQAREAARAFGHFQHLLADLPAPRLHETIPSFHHTRRRFTALEQAIQSDPRGRAALVVREIAWAREREAMVDRLIGLQADGRLPERITHNDTKLNNVMLDNRTGRAACVIDLDTVMPGLALYDFGDMVRSATNSAAEDQPDPDRVQMRMPVYTAIVDGYLESTRAFLNPTEIDLLSFAARLLTFESCLRFLTDYLLGDVYFKTKRPDHNLDRCRNQFALLRSMEAQSDGMDDVLRRFR
jgi:Ser/Thr protein kinase RdoA (MazF antagonist)